MSGRFTWVILVFPLLLSFNGEKPMDDPVELVRLYQKADKLYGDEKANDASYTLSLNLFQTLIGKLENNSAFPGADSLLFQSYLKRGILLEILRKNYKDAGYSYQLAIEMQKRNAALPEELLFKAYTYAGSCYYNLNHFDSANYFLSKAQEMIGRIPQLPDKEVVFNTLGVLYYDNGNYQQSRNYFSKALELILNKKPFDKASAVSIETNMATALYRMDQFAEAIVVYRKVLQYNIYTDFVNLNLGRAYSAQGKFQDAIACYRKVNVKVLPGVCNEMANAQIHLHQFQSALTSLDQLKKNASAASLNPFDLGINDLYRADLFMQQGRYSPALTNLQDAICIFSGRFNDSSIYSNPQNFAGTQAYFWLYDALFKKASCFESNYQLQKNEGDLRHALDAYKSMLSLLAYVEKSYATDDAKTFLKKKSWQAYQKAFEVCLELHQLRPSEKYLEEAFLVSERNKASIVAASLNERAMAGSGSAEDAWIQEERNLKFNIAKLDVLSDQSRDKKTRDGYADEKAGLETRLAELQKKIEKNNHYYKIKYDDVNPGIEAIQKQIKHDQALISFYESANSLHAFLITDHAFKHIRIDSLATLRQSINEWLSALKDPESGKKFNGTHAGSWLSARLINPIQGELPGKTEWIIIPDGLLSYLPFESLPIDGGSRYLVETTAISYQLSTRFLVTNEPDHWSRNAAKGVLGFAPFAGKPGSSAAPSFAGLSPLPASGDEIEELSGKKFLNREATKAAFLNVLNQFPIVHLATHARSDMENSAASYVAFYPNKESRAEDNLYLEELYGLNMDSIQLMIISACETGQGELVNNEGVISIARAFTYAGCSSVINSLWKADDKATAAILKQFHYYLKKGFSKSIALQKAKLDYIKGNSLHRTPDYWSHLVLVGNARPLYAHKKTWLIAMAGGCMLFAGLLLMSLNKGKKVDAFMDKGS